MSDETYNPAAVELRIAKAQAARTPVDSQGRPTGKPARFNYDERGRLVDATPPDASPPDEAA